MLGLPGGEVEQIVLNLVCSQSENLGIGQLTFRLVCGQFLFISRADVVKDINVRVNKPGCALST